MGYSFGLEDGVLGAECLFERDKLFNQIPFTLGALFRGLRILINTKSPGERSRTPRVPKEAEIWDKHGHGKAN